MKSWIIAVVGGFGLAGCIAVPAPYYYDPYYAAPSVSVGVGFHGGRGHHHHHRGHGHRHWR